MPRERWFYAEGHRRMGPVSRRELVEALLQLTDPRTCLVWRRGLQTWTPCGDVPDIDQLLSAQVPAPAPLPVAAPPPPVAPPVETRRAGPRRAARGRPADRPPSRSGPYLAGALSALIVAGIAWFFWPRPVPPPPAAEVTPAPATPAAVPTSDASLTPEDGGTPVPPSAVRVEETTIEVPTAAATTAGRTGLGDQEADLPQDELKRLRGVGGWSGDTLTITLYNGSSWRVTEIFVLTSRMEGDRFVDSVAPHSLLPAGGEQVQGAVKNLLEKVAPGRKRPGVNPADTGPFEVVLGPQPAAYRWKIERARGYPPQ
jgi:hypothetical protein